MNTRTVYKQVIQQMINTSMKCAFTLLLVLSLFSLHDSTVWAEESAVILVYHHVSETTPASTSVTPKQFEEHLAYINEHFNVVPLHEIVSHLKHNTPLEANSLAITFDDGYNNILSNAHPLLVAMNMPYTIFVNPKRIGNEYGQLSWQQLSKMQDEGVTIANHTLDHLHMLDKNQGETDKQWLMRVWNNVDSAQQYLESKLDHVPKWLAYPFGEYNKALADKLIQEGYIGFAQHSGAIGSNSPQSALPRFPAAGIYANLNSLKVKMHSLAMPVTQSFPDDPERARGEYFSMRFSVSTQDISLNQLQCFYQGKPIAHSIEGNTVSIDTEITIPVGRSRINCTHPSRSKPGRYYWYSQPFFVADKNGRYPN